MHIAARVTFVTKGIVQTFGHGIFIQNPGDLGGGGDFSVWGFSVIWSTMPNMLKHIQKLPKRNFSALTMEVCCVNSS
jgi:hypothetical protein